MDTLLSKDELRSRVEEILSDSKIFIPQFNGLTFEDSSYFSETKHEYSYVIFRNCIFEDDFILDGRGFSQGLVFVDCTFRKSLKLTRLNLSDSYPFFRASRPNIYIKKCSIADELKISGQTISGIEIIESQIDKVTIVDLKTKSNLFFVRCDISEIFITSSEVGRFLQMAENKIGGFELEGLCCDKVNILRNEIRYFYTSWLEVGKNDIGRYHIAENTIQRFNFMVSAYYRGYYFIRSNVFKGKSEIDSYTPWHINPLKGRPWEAKNSSLYEETYLPKVFLLDNVVDATLEIRSSRPFERICLKLSPSSKGSITVFPFPIKSVDISGIIQSGSLIMDLKSAKNVTIKELINYGNIKLSNYDPVEKSRFCILSSNMGKTIFSLCNFRREVEVGVVNSNLSDIQFSSVYWFDENNLNEQKVDSQTGAYIRYDWEEENFYYSPIEWRVRQNYEVFKQLKNAAQRSEERDMVVHFRSTENRLRYKILAETVPWFNRERLLLSLNRTNDFGANWTKPLLLVGATTLATYVLIVASFSLVIGPAFLHSVTVFLKNLVGYLFLLPQLFNPVHFLGTIFDPEQYKLIRSNFFMHFVDILQRFALSYLFVQTVIAFRKQSN